MVEDLGAYYKKQEILGKRERRWQERLDEWAESEAAVFLSCLRDQINRFKLGSGTQLQTMTLAPDSSVQKGAVAFEDSRLDYQFQGRVLDISFLGNKVANHSFEFDVQLLKGNLEHFKDYMTQTPTSVVTESMHCLGWRKKSRGRTSQLLQSHELANEMLKRLIDNRMV